MSIQLDQTVPSGKGKELSGDGLERQSTVEQRGVSLSYHDLYGPGDPDEFIPPENLAMVSTGIYRAALAKKKNFPYLRRLGLRSILTLFQEDYPVANLEYLRSNNIQLFQFGVPGNKEPFVDIPSDVIRDALSTLLDVRNHPILIHCNKGKHRTGCLVGCLRKLQSWSHTSICDEYRRFSYPKSRTLDQQFIELFDISGIPYDKRYKPAWL